MPSLEKISVVMPAFNAAGTISEAVESVLGQSYANVEIIVVDDGSTDDTVQRVEAFGERVVLVRREHSGLSSARNAGHRTATGDFVAWLDADDVAHPDRLSIQLDILVSNPDVVLVSSDYRAFDAQGPTGDGGVRNGYSSVEALGGLAAIYGSSADFESGGEIWQVYLGHVARHLVFGNFIHPPTILARRSAIDTVGDLVPAYPVADDWLYFLRLAGVGPFAFVDAALLRYRISAGQITSNANQYQNALDNLRALVTATETHPALGAEDPARLRRAFAERHLDLAQALAGVERSQALRHVIKSARFGGFRRQHLRALARVLAPKVAVAHYRRLKDPS